MAQKLIRAGFQSCSIMVVADGATQLLIEKRAFYSSGSELRLQESKENDQKQPQYIVKEPQKNEDCMLCNDPIDCNHYDAQRTLRWGIAGLTLHGPYFFRAFSKIDNYFASGNNKKVTFKKVMQKTMAAQFVAFPPYLVCLFLLIGILEHGIHRIPSVIENAQNKVPKAFLGGCIFWPVANIINFTFIPASARVPYLAGVGSIFNCYLSWLNAKNDRTISTVGKDKNEQ